MGDACTNTTRPGTHEEYIAAGVCCGVSTSHFATAGTEIEGAA